MSYPLTSQGVVDLLEELYELSDPDLALQAEAVQTDFRTWVSDNFDLSGSQVTYLSGMSENDVTYFGQQIAFCFIHRLNISFEYPSPPEPTGYGKWTESTNSTKLTANGSGGTTASGELVFTMVYIPLR
jgi:hypothetical protein